MGVGSTTKRRRSGTESSANSATPSRAKTGGTGRGRGRPPNVPRDGRERPPPLAECFRRRCTDVLDRLSRKDHYNIFLEPVNTEDVVGYAETIKNPMDFTTMRTKLSRHAYKSLGEFRKDLDLIWSNCLLFNGKEPTNIFSKKAIELKRLTEKLIVTTRQYLEKDKESLLKWKEKHRKRKETMQANAAAHAHVGLHGPNLVVSKSLASRLPRPPSGTGVPDPMDTSANEYPAEDHNGRTPEQNALAESLRLQYAGTSGLYKKGAVNAPFPQYTRPDGSIVQVPIQRYRPEENNWKDQPSGIVQAIRQASVPALFCDSLPRSRKRNPSFPRRDMDCVRVQDFAESMYRFVTDTGPIAKQIVTELLSPELTIKKKQEEFLRQGYTLRDLAEREKQMALRAKEAAARAAVNRWDAESIAKLADDIERVNQKSISFLPKLSRQIDELDGLSGLGKCLDPSLVKQIEETPIQVIDYAMPHGVNLESLNEICRVQSAPGIQISQRDVQCMISLRKKTEDYLQRLGSERTSKLSGTTLLSPAELHQYQARSRQLRQQRKVEAARQAAIIQERLGGTRPESLVAQHKRDLESIVQSTERAGLAAARAAAGAAYRTMPQDRTTAASKVAVSGIAMQSQLGNAAMRQQLGAQALRRSTAAQLHATGNNLPPPDKNSACSNCGTRDTLGWRTDGVGSEGVERLCLPCGLYWQKTNRHRPKDQCGPQPQRRPRAPATGTLPNGLIPGPAILTPQRPGHATAPSNGIAKRSIQKKQKTPQSSSRRSPSSSGSRGRAVTPIISAASPPFNHGVANAHRVQPLTSLPSFVGVGHHGIPTQLQGGAQIFTNQQGVGTDVRNNMPVRKLHAAGSSLGNHQPGSGTPLTGVSGEMVSTGALTQRPSQPNISQATYGASHNNPGQPVSLVPIQKHQLLPRQTVTQQHLQPSPMGTAHSAGYSVPIQHPKTGGLVLNANGGMHHTVVPNQARMPQIPSSSDIGIQSDQQKTPVGVGEPLMTTGNNAITPFASQGPSNTPTVGSFGDSLGRGTFPNGSGINGDGVGSDQIVEDIFFAEGGIDAPTGSPDFDF